jgi:sulfite exporter TauE/SafE
MEAIWFAAFMLGLAGGGHCAGMCGGIVGALTLAPGGRAQPIAFASAYHAGRAFSYALAGAVIGLIGEAGLTLRGTLEVQQVLFAVASVALLLAGLSLAGWTPVMRPLEAAGNLLWRRIEPWSRTLIPATTPLRAALLGMLWGWLPCGMVYAALLLALGAGSIAGSAITMFAFALGTLPGLIAVGAFVRARAVRPADRRLRVAGGAVVAAAGLYGLVQLVRHEASLADFCRLPFVG